MCLFMSKIFYCIIYVFILGGVLSGFAERNVNAIHMRKVLSAKLDSIEMEKQIRKRKGEPLTDLENESGKIHDSIAILRKQLIGTMDAVPRSQKAIRKKSYVLSFIQSLCKPTHIFDWIIIFVGGIALLSGVILIIGLIHTFFFRRKSRPSVHIPQKKSYKGQLSKESSGIPTSVSNTAADKENRDIDSLRKRIRKDVEHIQSSNNSASPFLKLDDISESPKEQKNKDSIIRAAKEGLDVHEISRKYHISVDQVALILRVAESGKSKNR